MVKAVKMCINVTKGRFTVDRSGKCFKFTNNLKIINTSRKDILFCFSLSIVNDMLACQPFRKFRKSSKCLGEVNKRKMSSTYCR